MDYLVQLQDAGKRHHVTLALAEADVRKPAIDVVFDVLGASPDALVSAHTINEEMRADFAALQAAIFDHDAQGAFIRDGVVFRANGRELDPDAGFDAAFATVEHEGLRYGRCDLVLDAPGIASAPSAGPASSANPASSAGAPSQEAQMAAFGLMLLLHRLALGTTVDVTKDNLDLADLLAEAERQGLTEIDVKKASYALSPKGKSQYDAWMQEAQDLIQRYDIYTDVDADSTGKAYFDTGSGQDLRVLVWDFEGLDPFRARFLLGLNDGEWDEAADWRRQVSDPAWYGEVFAPVENAPTVDEFGRARLQKVMDQAKAELHGEMT